jgi:hypothetical protein
MAEGIGRGEVEFEGYKKKGHIAQAKFMFEPGFTFHEIQVFLEGAPVLRIPAERVKGGRLFHSEKIDHGRPREGDRVTVQIDGNEVFSGQLVRD